ncbi:hypothetical protein RCH18_002033 [Flavobacterium sp. PL11]|jgi:hypothetical protein|nr:hypothetical protein [Flavobacterium sp. PL11]
MFKEVKIKKTAPYDAALKLYKKIIIAFVLK